VRAQRRQNRPPLQHQARQSQSKAHYRHDHADDLQRMRHRKRLAKNPQRFDPQMRVGEHA
jgi:hypothetical protein